MYDFSPTQRAAIAFVPDRYGEPYTPSYIHKNGKRYHYYAPLK